MWSDEINKKVREAEDSNHHSYTDKAWKGMETLLDKHLPVKKKRRRFIYLLLPALLGVGIATLLLLQNRDKNNTPVTQQKNNTVRTLTSPGENLQNKQAPEESPLSSGNNAGGINSEKDVHKRTASAAQLHTTAKENSQPVALARSEKASPVKRKSRTRERSISKTTTAQINGKSVDNPISKQDIKPGQPEQAIDINAGVPITKKDIPSLISPAQRPVSNETKKEEDSLQAATVTTKDTPKRKTRSFSNNFSLNFSFGPDISGVGIDNPGKVQLQYGIGAAYALSKNLSIRTGFYAGIKKYTADSADYYPPYTMNRLEKVDADCFVLEIPVTLIYNFNTANKHNWFIAGGASSYVMKKETYDYYYKNSWGQPQHYSHTYKNENTHLFAVVNISGGYKYDLTNRLSLMAEPYLKIPVGGVGVGKVKLTNTGVLFTVGFKPFAGK